MYLIFHWTGDTPKLSRNLSTCTCGAETTVTRTTAVQQNFVTQTGLPLFSLSISPFVRCLPCLWTLFFCLYMPGLWPCCFSTFADIFYHVGKSGNLLPHSHWRHNRGVSSDFPGSYLLQNKRLDYSYSMTTSMWPYEGWIFHINLHDSILHYCIY